jgi:acyl carrier protein
MSDSAEQISDTIIGMIAAQKSIPRQTITPASTFDELNMDSLDKINLSFEVEEHFKISIPDDALNSLRNVADVIAGVQRLQQESAPRGEDPSS